MELVDIEKSIIKKYRKTIWSKFIKAIKEYELVKDNDKIAVCISGGKDSFLMAKCFQELKRHGQMNFELEFIVMDPGYKEETLHSIKENAISLNIPLNIFKTDVFEIADTLNDQSPCYMCARMRRGHLYNYAKELGCNKIALGHHFDDVIETILLSLFYAGDYKTMMPKLRSDHFEGMELIRPLYLIKEEDIIAWGKYNELGFINCACKFTEKNSQYNQNSKRIEMKELIKELRKKSPYIEKNIFKSTHNVNLHTVIGYHKNKENYNFLDDYDN